jgi:hypothetical protein
MTETKMHELKMKAPKIKLHLSHVSLTGIRPTRVPEIIHGCDHTCILLISFSFSMISSQLALKSFLLSGVGALNPAKDV